MKYLYNQLAQRITMNVKKSISGILMAMMIVIPVVGSAAGTPTFSLLGIESVKAKEVTVSVAFDPNGATYQWETQPKISIAYTNMSTGQSGTSLTIGAGTTGSRTVRFVIQNLAPDTNYSYRAMMSYGGVMYATQYQNVKTSPATESALGTSSGSAPVTPTGSPTFELGGVEAVFANEATIQVLFDSKNAQYQWSSQPKISVSYTEIANGTAYTTLAVGQSVGARTTTFTLRELKPNTKYAYKAVMTYAGVRQETLEKTFTTKNASVINVLNSTTTTATATTNNSFINLFTGSGTVQGDASVSKAVGANKVASNLESIVKTGGYGSKNGVSLAITDSHARVVDGDTFEYTIQYHNENNKILRLSRIVVQLPDQYAFVNGDGNTVYSENDNVVTIYIGSIQPYESGTIVFKAKAVGGASEGVETKAMLVYTGGSVSATDRDTFVGGAQGVLGATVFGSGFFPQTFFGWLVIIVILLIIMIVARRYMKPAPLPEIRERDDMK